MISLETLSGAQVYPIGIGTWNIASRENPDTEAALRHTGYKNVEPNSGNEEAEISGIQYSLLHGQNYLDTAGLYGAGYTNKIVGQAIASVANRVPRESLFIAHNVWKSDYSDVCDAVERSLGALGIGYFDVAGPHSPHTEGWDTPLWQATMPGLAKLIDRRLIRGVSVSNFSPSDIEEASDRLGQSVATAQMGFSVLDQKNETLAYCQQRNIQVIGYQALRGGVLQNSSVRAVARAHGASPAQVSLAFVIQRGVLPITKSIEPAHIDDNLMAIRLSLTSEEMDMLSAVGFKLDEVA